MSILTALVDVIALLPATTIPDPEPQQPPGTEGFITIMGWVKWGGFAAAVVALIVAAIAMMFNSHRGEGDQHVGRLGKIAIAVVIVGAAAGLVGMLAGG